MKHRTLGLAVLSAMLGLAVAAWAGTTTLTVVNVVKTGLTTSYTGSLDLTASETYKFRNNGRVFLHFKKSEATAASIVIVTPHTVAGLAVADLTVAVPASTGDVMIGPFPPAIFNDSSGDVSFGIGTNVDGLTVLVGKL